MRPASMLSWPSSGPMVRSSRKVSSAGRAPARSRIDSWFAWSKSIDPEIWPDPPVIAERMTGAEMTSLSRTIAKGWPILAEV